MLGLVARGRRLALFAAAAVFAAAGVSLGLVGGLLGVIREHLGSGHNTRRDAGDGFRKISTLHKFLRLLGPQPLRGDSPASPDASLDRGPWVISVRSRPSAIRPILFDEFTVELGPLDGGPGSTVSLRTAQSVKRADWQAPNSKKKAE